MVASQWISNKHHPLPSYPFQHISCIEPAMSTHHDHKFQNSTLNLLEKKVVLEFSSDTNHKPIDTKEKLRKLISHTILSHQYLPKCRVSFQLGCCNHGFYPNSSFSSHLFHLVVLTITSQLHKLDKMQSCVSCESTCESWEDDTCHFYFGIIFSHKFSTYEMFLKFLTLITNGCPSWFQLSNGQYMPMQ